MTLPFPDHAFGAFLFDMDGTLLSSIAAAERVWAAWATRHGLDVAAFLPTIHGVRAVETIRALNLPGVDIHAEVAALTQAELDDVDGIESIAGAAVFLAALPADRWAIVTSAPRQLAIRRLEAAGIPLPPLMVAGEDVTNGKPAPDCFLLAASRLGQQPHDCLVFEDAPAGIRAAEAAGTRVVVVTATHTHRFETAHPTIHGYEALAPLTDAAGRLVISGLAGRAA
ncbi:HAD-IA family hydrolase [Mesorhizobium sp. LHD-90]|uniref:HAD-IA family hydrolase n=1 Tax=Mesorhizobium sp. LHD-90 TaxID=3071414 RepID=UPI0027E1BA73|nr:HAD-IA family hydrolase [Mesorhizobium sp. LHD-90]MDQ6437900.1 HAD-IA family hydrolase [Mesorhizobium sp. LHD-90]